MAVDTFGLAAVGVGGLFLYAGIKGLSIPSALQTIIRGKSPSTAQGANAIQQITQDSSGATPVTGNAPAVASPTAYQSYAFSLFSQYGWGTDQQQPLVDLWNQESGWNPNAQNPTSTAYGIAQFLDSTWGPYGAKTSNWQLQIQYGLKYIHDRYGSPAGAEAHERQYNWY